MKFKLVVGSAILLYSLTCSGTKKLDTSINNHRSVSLIAEAKKENGQWKVEMLLPAGTWVVKTEEEQVTEILPGTPRATLCWTVSSLRWHQQDKPFQFKLLGESGGAIDIAVKYPDFLNSGQSFVLKLLGSGKAHL